MKHPLLTALALTACEPEILDDIPFLEPREPVPELSPDQDRQLMLVIDVSSSMSGLRELHYAGVAAYVDALTRPGDHLGITLFAEKAATAEGTSSYSEHSLPWVPLTDVSADLGAFWERVGTICPECDADALNEHPAFPRMRGCTNPGVGVAQAAQHLASSTPSSDFRGLVVITGHGFNCGGELAGALAAADVAYDELDVHIWTIQPEYLGVQMNQVPYLTRGAGFFQYTEDPNEVPALYARAAAGLPVDGG